MSCYSLLFWQLSPRKTRQELEFSCSNSPMMEYPLCHTACFPGPSEMCLFQVTGRNFTKHLPFGGRHLFDPVRENLDSAADSNKSCLMVLEASIHQLGRSTLDIIFYIAFIKLFTLVAASLAAKSQFIYEIASSCSCSSCQAQLD